MKIIVIGSVAAVNFAPKARRNTEEAEIVVYDQSRKDISYSVCGSPTKLASIQWIA